MGGRVSEHAMPKGSESSSASSSASDNDNEFRDAEMQRALAQLKKDNEKLKKTSAELEEGFAALKKDNETLQQILATLQDTASLAHKRSLSVGGPAPKKRKMQTSKAHMGVLWGKRTSDKGKKPSQCD